MRRFPSHDDWYITRDSRRKLKISLRRIVKGRDLIKTPYSTVVMGRRNLFFVFTQTLLPQQQITTYDPALVVPFSNFSSFWQLLNPLKTFYAPRPLFKPSFESSLLQAMLKTPSPLLSVNKLLYFMPFEFSIIETRFRKSNQINNVTNVSIGQIPARLNSLTTFFYVNKSQENLTRLTTLRFDLSQRVVYSSLRTNRLLQNTLTELNIHKKRANQIYSELLSYSVSKRLIGNITHQERVPPFNEILPRYDFYPHLGNSVFSWNSFFSNSKLNLLRRTSFGSHISLNNLLSKPTLKWSRPQTRTNERTYKTRLTAGTVRQFMKKRLFRPLPARTFFRVIRFARKLISRVRRSNIRLELKKKQKKIDAIKYEKALFEEILTTPKGTAGPLLKALLYTGFERMPFLNQQFGNQLFIKSKKARPNLFNKKLVKRRMRRYEVRDFLKRHSRWGEQTATFRSLLRASKEIDFFPDSDLLLPEDINKKAKYARRYWKENCFFCSSFSVKTLLRDEVCSLKKNK